MKKGAERCRIHSPAARGQPVPGHADSLDDRGSRSQLNAGLAVPEARHETGLAVDLDPAGDIVRDDPHVAIHPRRDVVLDDESVTVEVEPKLARYVEPPGTWIDIAPLLFHQAQGFPLPQGISRHIGPWSVDLREIHACNTLDANDPQVSPGFESPEFGSRPMSRRFRHGERIEVAHRPSPDPDRPHAALYLHAQGTIFLDAGGQFRIQ